MNQTPKDLCGNQISNPNTYRMLGFVSEVFKIGFKDDPDYEKLKFQLTRAILDSGGLPNNDYDWIGERMLLRRLEERKQSDENDQLELRDIVLSNESINSLFLSQQILDERTGQDDVNRLIKVKNGPFGRQSSINSNEGEELKSNNFGSFKFMSFKNRVN